MNMTMGNIMTIITTLVEQNDYLNLMPVNKTSLYLK